MLKNSIMFAALIFVSLFAAGCGKAQTTNDAAAKIYGDWMGESNCVDKEKHPACKDEKVVYHFSKSTDDASKIHLAADKIVDGKNELMYELDFTYDAAKNTISGEFTKNQYHGIWEYQITGDTMEGTLKMLPDKTLARQIKVKKKD
ncbi:MAG: hypothetical protein WA584_21650 [Pyrinomonadaceae bacterium]